jgi:hypothetical protein
VQGKCTCGSYVHGSHKNLNKNRKKFHP